MIFHIVRTVEKICILDVPDIADINTPDNVKKVRKACELLTQEDFTESDNSFFVHVFDGGRDITGDIQPNFPKL